MGHFRMSDIVSVLSAYLEHFCLSYYLTQVTTIASEGTLESIVTRVPEISNTDITGTAVFGCVDDDANNSK